MANEQVYYSALHWAKKAEASAKLAADLAQTEGKVIQLGFDGYMQDGRLVFKHAPGGVEVPYHLVDDVEYELDLAYNGDLDSLTTMVVKNGSDTISFVSALHRSSTEPARVADMDAVMRHDTTTGYRWLFKATFKIAPNGSKVFLLYPVVAAKDYSDITNCITEIPQDIKLELNNGTLTLKAGSKVYVPNGFEADGVTPKFDVKIIESDVSVLNKWSTAEKMSIFLTSAQNVDMIGLVRLSSGSSAPTATNAQLWYDTTNNIIKRLSEGTIVDSGLSLPIAICTKSSAENNAQISSIDQVFNGFGYIGSTIFALPGVKGLIPNGRNADGSLKNIEFTNDKVLTQTKDSSWTQNQIQMMGSNEISGCADYDYFYDESNNYNVILIDNRRLNYVVFGSAKLQNGAITSFTPKLPFRAVDRNDSSWVAQQAMPSGKYINLTLGASGAIYTAPANGWVFASANISDQHGYLQIYKGLYSVISRVSKADITAMCLFPVKKGENYQIYYTTLSKINYFRFIYAEGE